jgi:hypothetical protein
VIGYDACPREAQLNGFTEGGAHLHTHCFHPIAVAQPFQQASSFVFLASGTHFEHLSGIQVAQALPLSVVDNPMCHVLRAGTEMEHGHKLRARIDCQPEPENLFAAAQPGAQFVQLEVREPEIAEGALVQGLSVLTSAGQPGGDGGLPVAEDTFSGGRIQPFGKGSQHHCDLVGRGFQTIQGGVATSSERGAAGLTAKRLDALSMAMCTISNQGVNVSIGDSRVRTLSVRTGEALCVHPLRCSPAAFHLTPGAHRRRRWLHNRRESGGEATGWTIAWGAWLEETLDRGMQRHCSRVGRAMMGQGKVPKPCQGENEEEQEQEQKQMLGHKDPRYLK